MVIRPLQAEDIEPIVAAFDAIGWQKPAALYQRYLAEQRAAQRSVLVAWHDATFAGYVTISWYPDYAPFQRQQIPEIQDLNVLPKRRRRGIGSKLLDQAEQMVAQRSAVVGIGVGLYADYGAAQRLYVRRGFVPDGHGIAYACETVAPGQPVIVDDDLVLYFTKRLAP